MGGRVAVITGGSRGIGAATAKRLFATMDVFLAGADTEANFEAVARDCRSQRPDGRVEYGVFDFLDVHASEAMIEGAYAAFGRVRHSSEQCGDTYSTTVWPILSSGLR